MAANSARLSDMLINALLQDAPRIGIFADVIPPDIYARTERRGFIPQPGGSQAFFAANSRVNMAHMARRRVCASSSFTLGTPTVRRCIMPRMES